MPTLAEKFFVGGLTAAESLIDDFAQAIQCQKNWLDNRIVHSELTNAVIGGKKST